MINQTIKNSLSPVKGTIVNMTELDIQHKTDFEQFVRAEPNGRFRAFMVELFDRWHQYNRDYFEGKLVIPTYILLGTPTKPSVLGQYATVSSFGGTSEIRIRPTLFTGKHPSINASAPMEGRNRFLFDVLLHEMVHQFQFEILGKSENSFHGHGPIFRDECNRISDIIGITQRVRTSKKRGKDADLPGCQYWPHCVRPDDYYMGAWIEKGEKIRKTKTEEPTTDSDVSNLDLVLEILSRMSLEEKRVIHTTLSEELNRPKPLIYKKPTSTDDFFATLPERKKAHAADRAMAYPESPYTGLLLQAAVNDNCTEYLKDPSIALGIEKRELTEIELRDVEILRSMTGIGIFDTVFTGKNTTLEALEDLNRYKRQNNIG